ncbi:hydroxymethylbilane synthase [Gephyromycinifex aptenodytis]|uniref:hydroxymethylbilane synthase n=1 Tax=Gephyromycinifex aptenodytis TaxID=2716227 RepID=UPI0014470D33|nr:hydroxymethylbilane synthase [Gephyromycinifex aptenodytis]
MNALRLGTRRSNLATTQSDWVADLLRTRGHEVKLAEVVTEGDVNLAPLTQIGGTGVFASALRAALRAGEVDFAVHSLKDLPVAPEPGLVIAAIPPREDPRDVLVTSQGRTLADLPAGAKVGTGSPRRAAQLHRARPDLQIHPIRGNVERRIAQVVEGPLDAVILAGAGLRRLGRERDISEYIDLAIMLPAAGQGALAVECREDDERMRGVLAALDDATTRAAVSAERALLGYLEAGCTAPIGAYATVGEQIELEGFIGGVQDDSGIRLSAHGPAADPAAVGQALARRMIAAGADRLGDAGRSPQGPSHLPPRTTGGTRRDDANAHAQTHQEHHP